MSDKITGVEAVTKDEPSRVRTADGSQRLGVGLDYGRDGKYWLWMGDGTRTLAVEMTAKEVNTFSVAIGMFPHADFGDDDV